MVPATFGKYLVTEELGRGGMAEVYAGIHPDLGRKVAIKVILPQFATESDFEERFRREARVVASLRHAHIVQLYDFDVVDGRHFMVMEHLDGGTLKDYLRKFQQQKSRMTLIEIADLLDPLAGALDYAHSRGAIHRDIKPANILFTTEREPVLTDFGIAKLLADAVQLTATGGVVGSPFYMPPEQATGGGVDARSDQYSLGVVLYEMATGRVPFQGSSAVAVMTQHLNSAPPAPRTVNAALPVAVEAVLLRALAKQAADRFGSASELAQAFRQAVGGVEAGSRSKGPDQSMDQAARTVLGHAGASADESAQTDAATLLSTASDPTPPHRDAATEMANRAVPTASPSEPAQDAATTAPPPRVSPPKADIERTDDTVQPPALDDRGRQGADDTAHLPARNDRHALDARPHPVETPKPTAQNFNIGGIQAGVVNQGGEQTFTGDLTFNLDFGELKAAPPPQEAAANSAPQLAGDESELAAILETLRRSFDQSSRVERFVKLVTQFHAQLGGLPAERADDRKQVVKRVQALLMEMTQSNPDPDMVEIMGTSLERAVKPLSVVDPDLPTMVTRITSWVELMVEPE